MRCRFDNSSRRSLSDIISPKDQMGEKYIQRNKSFGVTALCEGESDQSWSYRCTSHIDVTYLLSRRS